MSKKIGLPLKLTSIISGIPIFYFSKIIFKQSNKNFFTSIMSGGIFTIILIKFSTKISRERAIIGKLETTIEKMIKKGETERTDAKKEIIKNMLNNNIQNNEKEIECVDEQKIQQAMEYAETTIRTNIKKTQDEIREMEKTIEKAITDIEKEPVTIYNINDKISEIFMPLSNKLFNLILLFVTLDRKFCKNDPSKSIKQMKEKILAMVPPADCPINFLNEKFYYFKESCFLIVAKKAEDLPIYKDYYTFSVKTVKGIIKKDIEKIITTEPSNIEQLKKEIFIYDEFFKED